MTIPHKIHTRLSASERIRAAVSAMARDDDGELQTLRETCPRKSYLVTDPAYSDGMNRLFTLVLSLEFKLASYALDFQTARLHQGMKQRNIQECALKATASLVAAMDQLFAEIGLDPQAIAKSRPPRHPFVTAGIKLSEGEADPDHVALYLQGMREMLPTC
jgi:hypothetical protein